jgi:hypothetical protein
VHETIEALSAYVDGEVSPPERARIEAHLAACVDCASRRTLLERASSSVRTLPVPEPTTDEARRIREGIKEDVGNGVLAQTRRPRRVRRGLSRGLRPVWAGAGAFLLVIVAVIAGSLPFRGNGGNGSDRRSETTTAAPGSSGAGMGAIAFDSPGEVRSFVSQDAEVKRALDAAESLGPADAAAPPAVPAQGGIGTAPAAPQAPAPAPQRFGAKAPAQSAPDAASAPVPNTLQTPADPGRNELRAAGPERSIAECLAERQEGTPAVRLATTRPATYAGTPAWLLVYAVPAPARGGPEQVAVDVVARADCALLTHLVFVP